MSQTHTENGSAEPGQFVFRDNGLGNSRRDCDTLALIVSGHGTSASDDWARAYARRVGIRSDFGPAGGAAATMIAAYQLKPDWQPDIPF